MLVFRHFLFLKSRWRKFSNIIGKIPNFCSYFSGETIEHENRSENSSQKSSRIHIFTETTFAICNIPKSQKIPSFLFARFENRRSSFESFPNFWKWRNLPMLPMWPKMDVKRLQLARNCATFGTKIRHFCQAFVFFSRSISGDTSNWPKNPQFNFSFEVPKMQILPQRKYNNF